MNNAWGDRRWTIAEIAEKLGVEVDPARGLVRFLIALELAEDCGHRPSGGKGRGVSLYRIDQTIAPKMLLLISRLEDEKEGR